jgi:hypothetical protein
MSIGMVNDRESIQQKAGQVLSWGNAPWLILAALVVLLCMYARVRLLNVPLERDEGEFAYFAQLMLRGVPPYLHAYTLKFPGAALMYALFMLIFGQSAWGIHLGLLIVNAMTVIMVFLLGRRLFGLDAAAIAAAAYAVLSLSQGVYGVFAHATHFVVLFALAGYLLLMRALESGRTVTLLGSGLCFGLAILMKQHGIFFALFALLYFLWERRKSLRGEWRLLPLDGLLFATAIAVPFGACSLWLFMAGAFDKFWFWTFQYAREYASNEPFAKGVSNFQRLFGKILETSLFLWAAAGIGMVLLFADKEARRGRVFAAGLLFFSFLAICPGLYFRRHYFIMLLPAIALLNGVAAGSARGILARRGMGGLSRVIPALLFLTIVVYTVYLEREFFFTMAPETASHMTYGENPFVESVPIAQYIREHSSPDDRIAVLGSEPQIYFYSGRLSATGHIYMYGLMENQRYAPVMQQELIRETETARPKFIVFVNVRSSWIIRPGSVTLIFDWAKKYLAENYVRVGVVDIFPDKTLYLWNTEAIGYSPRSQAFLEVYRRKNGYP